MANQIKEPQVLYDARGRKTHIVLSVKKYEELLVRLEDAEDLKAIKAVEYQRTVPWTEVKKKLPKKN